MSSQTLPGGLGSYVGRVWELRFFLASLVAQDLQVRYRRSFLGIGWSLLRPLATTAVFCLVFCNLFNMSLSDYAPFALIGLTLWQFLVDSTLVGCVSIVQGASYIRQRPMPLAFFPLRSALNAGLHAAIAMIPAIGLTWCFRGLENPVALLAIIPAFFLLFVLGWALATIAGVLYAHFHDTQHLLEIGLQICFYLTPIMYPPEAIRVQKSFAWVFELNPLAHVVEVIRRPILSGDCPPLYVYACFVSFVALASLVAIGCLKRWEKNLVFWV